MTGEGFVKEHTLGGETKEFYWRIDDEDNIFIRRKFKNLKVYLEQKISAAELSRLNEYLRDGGWKPLANNVARLRRKEEKDGIGAQAEELLFQKLKELKEGNYIEPTDMTVKEFLQKWMDEYVTEKNLKPKTIDIYTNMINNHIIPELGTYKLAKLKKSHIKALLTKKQKEGRSDGKEGGLSNRTVQYIHMVLKLALSHAVEEWELIPRNVAEGIKPPKVPKPKIQYWTKEEAKIFLNAVKSHRLYPLYLLALTTGMRRGELLGLRWKDVDFKKHTVRITQSLVTTSSGDKLQETTKTEKGERIIDISPLVTAELSKHRKRQAEEFMALGRPEKDLNLVFTSTKGTPLSPRNLDRHFKNTLKKLNESLRKQGNEELKAITFHGLRHTYATLMLTEYGQDVTTVSARLGHANVRVTYDVYSHVIPKKQKEAACKTDDLIAMLE